jgi:hypothetical protein
MYFFVFGLPGSFTEWCTGLTAALAGRAASRRPAVIEADTLDALALETINAGSSQAVVHSQRPGGRLLRALAQAERNFLVAADNPRSSLLELVLVRGFELTEAVRLVACGCAALARVEQAPGALILEASRDRAWPDSTIAAVARHFGMTTLDGGTIAALAEELAAADERPLQADDAIAWWNGLDRAQQRMVIGALGPYVEPDSDGGTLPITWTGDLFAACDRPKQAASAPIDITGRARRLIDGPDILLPVGAWSLTLTLSCNREAAEYEFLVEVAAGSPLAAATLRPGAEGEADIRIDFEIDDSADHPIAIRISTVRAAFDGVVSLVAASLVRAAPD